MEDRLKEFSSSLNLHASRVINFPALVFLCGGPIPKSTEEPQSLRGLFLRRLEEISPDMLRRVRKAEDASRWHKMSNHYENLLDLEDHLACLAAMVLVFVESAGSIAELGVFCKAKEVSKKLVAVLEHGRLKDASFIQDGPLDVLRKKNATSVQFFPWLGPADECGRRNLDPSRATESVNDLLNFVSRSIEGRPSEQNFVWLYNEHKLLLIADLIEMGVVVQRKEIESLLEGLGKRLRPRDLSRNLFLLENLHLIERTQRGNRIYYLPPRQRAVYIRYAHKEETQRWDRKRAKVILSEILLCLNSDRKKALRDHDDGSKE